MKKMSLNKISKNELNDVKGGRPPIVCPCACLPGGIDGQEFLSNGDGYGVFIRYH